MLYIPGGEGAPRVLADFCLRQRLEVTNPALTSPLSELAANKACECIYFSYNLSGDEPHLLVISRFLNDVSLQQMLEITGQAFESLVSMCTSQPRYRSIHLSAEDWYSDDGYRQDLFLLEGPPELVESELMLEAEHFVHTSTFSWDTSEDEHVCQLSGMCKGLTPVLPGHIRRGTVMFMYDSEQERQQYIDPQKESYDSDGQWSRYQDDWLDLVAQYSQHGAKVEGYSLSLSPWPSRVNEA